MHSRSSTSARTVQAVLLACCYSASAGAIVDSDVCTAQASVMLATSSYAIATLTLLALPLVELAQHLQQLGPGYSGTLDTIMPFSSSTNSSNIGASTSETNSSGSSIVVVVAAVTRTELALIVAVDASAALVTAAAAAAEQQCAYAREQAFVKAGSVAAAVAQKPSVACSVWQTFAASICCFDVTGLCNVCFCPEDARSAKQDAASKLERKTQSASYEKVLMLIVVLTTCTGKCALPRLTAASTAATAAAMLQTIYARLSVYYWLPVIHWVCCSDCIARVSRSCCFSNLSPDWHFIAT
eukprot:5999-Heterococcus_DN1.PRE.1